MKIKELVNMWRDDALQMVSNGRTDQAATMRRCADDLMNERNAGRIIDAPDPEDAAAQIQELQDTDLVAAYKRAVALARKVQLETCAPDFALSDTNFTQCVTAMFIEIRRMKKS